jgi:putative RecB family exonuclease
MMNGNGVTIDRLHKIFDADWYSLKTENGQSAAIELEGVIDLIEEDDTITEFKTSVQTMDSQELENHLQLTIYSYAFERISHKPPKSLKIVNFVKSKKPKMIPMETKRGKDNYQRLYFLAGQIHKGIQQHIFFPRNGFLCKDCEYGENCKTWKGN